MAKIKVVLKLGDDISTDIIYPGRFMATVLPVETPAFAFADNADFNGKLKAGKIPAGSAIVAGKNFGCGSSREQAVSCLKGYSLAIVAKDISRIFLQSAINLGLNIVVCPAIDAAKATNSSRRRQGPTALPESFPRTAPESAAGNHRRGRTDTLHA